MNATEDGASYECVVINDAGYDVAITNLYVRPFIVEHPEDMEPQTGDNITLSCRAEGFPYPSQYRWQKLNTAKNKFEYVTGADGNVLELGPIQFDDFGRYRCCATAPVIDEETCSNTATVTGECTPTSSGECSESQ